MVVGLSHGDNECIPRQIQFRDLLALVIGTSGVHIGNLFDNTVTNLDLFDRV